MIAGDRRPRFLVAVTLALAACGNTPLPPGGVPQDAVGGAGGSAVGGGGGAAGAQTAPQTVIVTITTGGRARLLLVHVPPRPTGSGEPLLPLVLNLHGSGGTAANQETATGMDRLADEKGFLVAYPQADIALGGGFAWNVPGQPLIGGGAVPPDAADDVQFLGEAVAELAARFPVDGKRVYATGMSGGARMTSQLGCGLSTVLAAIAPVAGIRFPAPCDGTRPVPVVAFHGTADATNPYDGNGQAYWTYSVPSAAQQWAAHDGCAAVPDTSAAAAGVQLTEYAGCAGGATVDLYTISGAGHVWPGAPGQTDAIEASAVMWAFFATHPLP